MQRIDIDKISRDVAAGRPYERPTGEGYDFSDWDAPRRTPTVVRVPLWLIVLAALAIVVMAAHG